jgi:3-oxoacyl-[acyl-carrier protein] reductase
MLERVLVTISLEQARLDGRVAVVTGGARGIGAGVALGLAAFGADVAMCDRDAEGLAGIAELVEKEGRRALTGVFDVRNGAEVEAFVWRVVSELGRVDVLVNNAGGTFHSLFMDVNAKGQSALVDENFTSVTHFIRACVPAMTSGGSIVNVTSVEAFRAAPGYAVYAAMKAGVEQLTRSLALELAGRRIRVNTIAPDAIPTDGDAALAAATHGSEGGADIHGYGSKVPLGMGSPDDCAGAVVWLAGDLAKWITGTTIHVDGGTNAARGWRPRSGGGWEP